MLDEAERNSITDADRAAFGRRRTWLDLAANRGGKQLPPVNREFNILLFRAGRGFGKTRTIHEILWWDCYKYPNLFAHMLISTLADLKKVTFEGPDGFQALIPPEVLFGESWEQAYNSGDRELTFKSGSKIIGFATTEHGNRLRGPACHILGGDEIAVWDKPAGNLEEAFNNARLGCRLPYPDGTPSRMYLGTTPKPIPFLRRIEAMRDVIVVRGSTKENIRNLSANYISAVLQLEGTLSGKQEIEGDYIEGDDTGIFKRTWFPLWPAEKKLPVFHFIIEIYDTAMSERDYHVKKQTTDPTASIVLGVFNVNQAFNEIERKKLGVKSKYAALLCDAWQDHLGFPDLLDKARAQHRLKWGAAPARRSDIVLIEQKQSGISLRQSLLQNGVPTFPYNPGRQSKTTRAHAVSPLVHQRMLFVPESSLPERRGLPRDWVEPFLDQVCAFAGPGSTEHDDFVDCLTSGLLYLRDRELLESAPTQPYLDLEEKREQEEREAVRIKAASEKRQNPYSA